MTTHRIKMLVHTRYGVSLFSSTDIKIAYLYVANMLVSRKRKLAGRKIILERSK
jgi:hypothetical protein